MSQNIKIPESKLPRIVIVGGGFGGLQLAKHLKGAPYQVVLLDRHNYHTFQPLLYQVATAGLEPSSIASPFRRIFENKTHVIFRMAEVQEVVSERNMLRTTMGDVPYDYLVLATGSKTNFFGMKDVERNAMPMKTIAQALELRSMMIQNFEKAVSLDEKSEEKESLIDIVVVGGGPTGIETAGALAELKKHVLPFDYPDLDLNMMDIYLVELGPRLLAGMSQQASDKSKEYLEKMGVHVWLNTGLESYDGYRASFSNGKTILTTSLIYAAGVSGVVINGIDSSVIARGQRIAIDGNLRVKGYSDIFAMGDVASFIPESTAVPLPMVAPVSMQMGVYLAQWFKKGRPKQHHAFRYYDKGSMATIGRHKAVVDLPFWKTQGAFAWFVWMFVHLMSLVGFANRAKVFMSWAYSYLSSDKRYRLVIRPHRKEREPMSREPMGV
jgi:NADH dehydrogenase